jgi:HSP20 family molecular chaperone IbpA
MASLPVNRYRRRSNDNKPDSDIFGNDFEWFDPWRDTSLNASTSFRWINQPKQQTAYEEKIAPALQLPTYGDKYRVKVNISDMDSETIKTTIEGRLLIIEAKKKHNHSKNENAKERKIYDLPELVYEHAGKICKIVWNS